MSARIDGQPPDGMFISAGGPTRSIRAHPVDDEELLLIGGEGHHAGAGNAQPERYQKLAAFAREHWRVRSFEHRWSTQDYSPADGVPYIGPLHHWSQRVHVATGFKKWGMTTGTLAAMIICDAILGSARYPPAARTSAARSRGTPPSRVGTAPATVRASASTWRSSTGPPCGRSRAASVAERRAASTRQQRCMRAPTARRHNTVHDVPGLGKDGFSARPLHHWHRIRSRGAG